MFFVYVWDISLFERLESFAVPFPTQEVIQSIAKVNMLAANEYFLIRIRTNFIRPISFHKSSIL